LLAHTSVVKKVRRYDRFPVMPQEGFPRCFSTSIGRWFNAVQPQNSGDRAAGALMSQIGQRTLDPAVTRTVILFSNANHQG